MTQAQAQAPDQQAARESAAAQGQRMVRLLEERGYLAEILGTDRTTVERFRTVMLSALTGSPKLLAADQASLVQAMREAAMWGLEPDGVDAVIVPFWNSRNSRYEADFQPTARGYVTVLYRSPRVAFVDADVVYEGDAFEYEKGETPRLYHRPNVFGDRGKRLGAYAVVRLDSGYVRPVVLNEQQIEQRRKVSRESEKGAWAEWADEMARKTALRSIMSLVPIARGVKAALAAESAKYDSLPAPEPVAQLAAPSRPAPALEAARSAFLGLPEPASQEDHDEWSASSTAATSPTSPTRATSRARRTPTSQSQSGVTGTSERRSTNAISDGAATEASTDTGTSGSGVPTAESEPSTESSWSRSSGASFDQERPSTTGTAFARTTARPTSSSGSGPSTTGFGRPTSSAPTAGSPTTTRTAPSAALDPEAPTDTAPEPDAPRQAEDGAVREVCGAESDPALGDVLVCSLDPGHLDDPKAPSVHRDASGSTFPAPRKGGAR